MRLTESQQAVHAALDALLRNLEGMDEPSAEAYVLQTGVPLLAEITDDTERHVYGGEIQKKVPTLESETLRASIADWNRRHGKRRGEKGRVVELVPACTIEPERTRYVYEGRIVAADLNLIVGPPGVGKGNVTMHLAARLTRGELVGDLHGKPAPVVIASAEDSAAHAIVPRLLAAGADMSLVYIVRVSDDDAEDGLTLPDDVPSFSAEVERVGAAMVIVDPIAAHLSGGVDSHKDASIRRALAPLARMAHDTRTAVVAVAHTNKAQGGDWVRRVGGSVGLGAAARNVLIAADDPDGDDRLFVHAKSNTGELAPSMRYRIEGREIECGGEAIATCGVAWLGEAEGVTAADVLMEREPEERSARDEAAEWLVAYLSERGGEAAAGDCIRAAGGDGIADRRTLQRARKAAGIETGKSGGRGTAWVWRLPKDDSGSRAMSSVAFAPLEESGGSSTSEDLKDDKATGDSDEDSLSSSEPGRLDGMDWREQRAARRRAIHDREKWGDDL